MTANSGNNRGLLLVLFDPAPPLEEELNAWYDTEHLPERAVIEGVDTARRYTSIGDGPRYAAIYDLASLDVLESTAYLAVSGKNFSPWTRRITSKSRPVRLTANQAGSRQSVTGPCARLLLLKINAVSEKDLASVQTGLNASFGGAPGFLQARAFIGVEPKPDFIVAIAEFSGNHVPALKPEAFGDCGRRIELAATYRPYHN
jgi:hypothetical protein